MSSLRKSSLVLKTSDITPTPAVVQGYYSTPTVLNVTNVISGTIALTTLIYGTGTVTSQATLNSSTGGTGTVTVVGQTAATPVTGNFSTLIGTTLYQTPTTSEVGSSISNTGVLTLGGANANVAIGQYLSGTGIVAGTYITGGAGLTWTVSNNTTVATTQIYFYTPVNILLGQVVIGTGIPTGSVITAGPTYNATYGIEYTMSLTTTANVNSEAMNFYTLSTINCLSLSDASVTNGIGTCNQTRTKFTFNNINLRTVLGDMYDKSDIFNLCLNTISSSVPSLSPSLDANNLIVSMKLSGLPLLNQTYDTGVQHNQNSTNIGVFQFSTTASNTVYYNSTNICTFSKNSDICALTIEYLRVIDNLNPNTLGTYQTPISSVFPHAIFVFDVIGIEKFNNQILFK